MIGNIKKILGGVVFSLFSFASIFMVASPALADNFSHKQPKIMSIQDISKTSVVVPFKFSTLKSSKATIEVKFKKIGNHSFMTKKINVTLDKNGKASLKIGSLVSGTKYSFKARVQKESGGKFTQYSNTKEAKTLK